MPVSPASVAVVLVTWPPKSIGSCFRVTVPFVQLVTIVSVNGSIAEEL